MIQTTDIPERVTARVVLLNNAHHILLLKTVLPDETFWLTPGGKIEDGETPLQAAHRELFEETGISGLQLMIPHSWYCEKIYMLDGIPTLFKEHFFLAKTNNPTVCRDYLTDDEKLWIAESKWWDLQDLLRSNELFYPYELLTELHSVIYQNYIPSSTTVVNTADRHQEMPER